MLDKLKSVSNDKLILNLKLLIEKEREVIAKIVLHLAEMFKRKLYLEAGYSSLFSYATKELKYSEAAAGRRIQAAKCIIEFPEVYNMLLTGDITLSAICKISSILNQDNSKEILSKIKGLSKSRLEILVCSYKNSVKREVKDKIEPIIVKKKDNTGEQTLFKNEVKKNAKTNYRSDSWSEDNNEETEQKVKLSFSADLKFLKSIETMKILLSGKYPLGADLETVFNEAINCYIEHNCPKEKAKRAEKRKESQKKDSNVINLSQKKDSRYIPAKVRAEVLKRDNYCCTYVSPSGKRCTSTWDLEIDHIIPVSKGGKSTLDNLRTTCRAHNMHFATNEFGTDFMDKILSTG